MVRCGLMVLSPHVQLGKTIVPILIILQHHRAACGTPPPPSSPPDPPLPPCRGEGRIEVGDGPRENWNPDHTYDYPEGFLKMDFFDANLTINNLGGFCGRADIDRRSDIL